MDDPIRSEIKAQGPLDGSLVLYLLSIQPAYAAYCPWESLDAECLLKILGKHPNQPEIVSRFNQWNRLPIDWVCDLLRAHPQLSGYCPKEIWLQFGRVHWAKLICADFFFTDKMKALGRDSLVTGWCCLSHWAKAYQSFYREKTVECIAENSAMNPEYDHTLCCNKSCVDTVSHIQWLATVAADFAEAAALAADPARPSPRDAETYALIAQAAHWQIRVLSGRLPG